MTSQEYEEIIRNAKKSLAEVKHLISSNPLSVYIAVRSGEVMAYCRVVTSYSQDEDQKIRAKIIRDDLIARLKEWRVV